MIDGAVHEMLITTGDFLSALIIGKYPRKAVIIVRRPDPSIRMPKSCPDQSGKIEGLRTDDRTAIVMGTVIVHSKLPYFLLFQVREEFMVRSVANFIGHIFDIDAY